MLKNYFKDIPALSYNNDGILIYISNFIKIITHKRNSRTNENFNESIFFKFEVALQIENYYLACLPKLPEFVHISTCQGLHQTVNNNKKLFSSKNSRFFFLSSNKGRN